MTTPQSPGPDAKKALCSCKSSSRDGQHMAWCNSLSHEAPAQSEVDAIAARSPGVSKATIRRLLDADEAPTQEPVADDDAYMKMLWLWFEKRHGKEHMRAEMIEGLSADDFERMLDEHEAELLRPAAAPTSHATREALQSIHDEINALGGRSDQDNSYDQGIVDTVAKALEIIEKKQAGEAEAPIGHLRAALERLADRDPRDEPGAWCQPMDNGKHMPRRFMIYFDDPDHGIMVFNNEAEARDAFERKNTAWNCYLFGALPKRTHTPPNGTES